MEPENQKKYTIISIGIIILLAFGVWYMFAGRNDVSDIRRGAQSVTEQLDRAESGQRAEALRRPDSAAGSRHQRMV